MKLNADEKELLESVERGEWKSVGRRKGTRSRYTRYAKATFRVLCARAPRAPTLLHRARVASAHERGRAGCP
jgi:hypothetical protein